MERNAKGPFALMIIGVVALLGYYYAEPILQEIEQRSTSDAAGDKGTITIGMDNFAGYFPLCSPVMKGKMLKSGYLLRCEDDSADYSLRMRNLSGRKIDFAVATVDSYLLTGGASDFPGTVIAVLDESKGADAIVTNEKVVKNIDALKSYTNLKLALTPDSPSDHLIKAVSSHFDIPRLKNRNGPWRVTAEGSTDALAKLKNGDANVAVLWEPDVSKALALDGYKKILGTDQTNKLIVDILLVNRKYSEENPELVKLLLSHYFRTLKRYRDNRSEFESDLASYANMDSGQVESLMKGINWVGLFENAVTWFGASQPGRPSTYGLFDTIDSTIQILIDYGDFAESPLPDGDPRRITFSEPITALFKQSGIAGKITAPVSKKGAKAINSLETDFTPLTANEWSRLKDVGTLKVRPILFQRGSGRLSLDGKKQLDKAINTLKSYPNFRVKIEGHSNPRGDAKANKELSLKRAEAVGKYLLVTYNIDPDRLLPIGLGSGRLLKQKAGEGQRGYYDRLSRVELHLVVEVY